MSLICKNFKSKTHILISLVLIIKVSILNSQELIWEGVGHGLSYVEIFEDHVEMQTFRDAFSSQYDFIKMQSGDMILYEKFHDHNVHRGQIKAKYLDLNQDSLIIKFKLNDYLFVRKKIFEVEDEINFNSVEYLLLDSWRGTVVKIEYNKYGIIRKSDGKNSTLIEFEVSKKDGIIIKNILSKIDIKNIYATDRIMNICNDNDHSFTFIDNNKTRYNYTAISIRKSLLPLYENLNRIISDHIKSKK